MNIKHTNIYLCTRGVSVPAAVDFVDCTFIYTHCMCFNLIGIEISIAISYLFYFSFFLVRHCCLNLYNKFYILYLLPIHMYSTFLYLYVSFLLLLSVSLYTSEQKKNTQKSKYFYFVFLKCYILRIIVQCKYI